MTDGEETLSFLQQYGSCCSGVLAAYASDVGMDMYMAGAACI